MTSKAIRKLLYILKYCFLSIATLVAAMLIIIQLPAVQTRIVDSLKDKFTSSLDADISYSSIKIRPLNAIVIKDLAVVDRNPQLPNETAMELFRKELGEDYVYTPYDTLLRAKSVVATFSIKGLFDHSGLHLGKATVSDGRVHLVLEENLSTNLQRMFHLKKGDGERKNSTKDVFDLRSAKLRNMAYSMHNIRVKHGPYKGGINFNDLYCTQLNVDAKHLKLSKNVMTGELLHCSFKEKSGFAPINISARTSVGRGIALIEDIHIVDSLSDVRAKYFSMSFDKPRDMRQFNSLVHLDGELLESSAHCQTLKYFVSALSKANMLLDIQSGGFHGYVNGFDVSNVQLGIRGSDFSTHFDGEFRDMEKTKPMRFDLRLSDCRTSSESLLKLIGDFSGKPLKIKKDLPKVMGSIDANLKGRMDDLAVEAIVVSTSGALEANFKAKDLFDKRKDGSVEGKLSTEDLDIGHFIGSDLVHQCSLEASLGGSLRGDDGPNLKIDTLKISRLNLNKYDYSKIFATGQLSKRNFTGRLISQDPNLNFLFQGIFAFAPKTQNALYQFYANIGHADLQALHFDKRDGSSLSGTANANFSRNSEGMLLGSIDLQNLYVSAEGQRHSLGGIHIYSQSADDKYNAQLASDFAEGTFEGTGSYLQCVNDLLAISLKRELPSLFKKKNALFSGNRYVIDFRLKDTRDLLAFFKPGLYIENGTEIKMNISPEGALNVDLNSGRLALGDKFIKGLQFNAANDEDVLLGTLKCEDINLNALSLKDNNLTLLADDDHFGIGFQSEGDQSLGELYLKGSVHSNERGSLSAHIDMLPSCLSFGGEMWSINSSCIEVVDSKDIHIKKLGLSSNNQSITIDGDILGSSNGLLELTLENFGLDIANVFLPKDKYSVEGKASGKVSLLSYANPARKKGILADLAISNAAFAGTSLGEIGIKVDWDEVFNRFNLKVGNNRTFNIEGNYVPSVKDLGLALKLRSFDLGIAKPMFTGLFGDMSGRVSADLAINGPLNKLSIASSGARFEDAEVLLDFTGVPYVLNGPFHVDEYGIYFDNVSLKDKAHGQASLGGKVKYNHFKDLNVDVNIQAKNTLLIDIPEHKAEGFYGTLTGDASVVVTGPLSTITVDIDGTTSGGGEFHIPTAASSKVSGSELLTFTKKEEVVEIDPYEQMMAKYSEKKKTNSKTDLIINLKAGATQNVDAYLEVDKSSGNGLMGNGVGNLDIQVRPSRGIFNLKGDYTLVSGKYTLNVANLAKREFDIKQGSNIHFNGDLMDSELDIEAVYRTKASLSRLISDTTSVNDRRLVECGLSIGDRLSSPSLGFSLTVPDLEPGVKSKVENALSTEDKVQKQFIALLVSNNFLPDEQSGITDSAGTGLIFSSLSSVLFGQLNNILQKLNIPLDVNMKYQQNQRGNDVFDVAVSTQLFNNRVVVNGNFGNRQYDTGTGNFAGDVDIEIKLDKKGAIRLNAFSHSADQYTNYLDNTQRNGIGITLQQEFDNFGQMVLRGFSKKSVREQLDAQREKMLQQQRKKIITIAKDGSIESVSYE